MLVREIMKKWFSYKKISNEKITQVGNRCSTGPISFQIIIQIRRSECSDQSESFDMVYDVRVSVYVTDLINAKAFDFAATLLLIR